MEPDVVFELLERLATLVELLARQLGNLLRVCREDSGLGVTSPGWPAGMVRAQ